VAVKPVQRYKGLKKYLCTSWPSQPIQENPENALAAIKLAVIWVAAVLPMKKLKAPLILAAQAKSTPTAEKPSIRFVK
jgi:hypothetical protein